MSRVRCAFKKRFYNLHLSKNFDELILFCKGLKSLSVKVCCDMLFQLAFTAQRSVIRLVCSNPCNYFRKSSQCSIRMLKQRVATQLLWNDDLRVGWRVLCPQWSMQKLEAWHERVTSLLDYHFISNFLINRLKIQISSVSILPFTQRFFINYVTWK